MRLVYVRDGEGQLREQLEPLEDAPPVEPLDLDTSYEVLRRNVIGRVGFLLQDRPGILPVTYGVDGDDVVFRTTEGSKLQVAESEVLPVVFEVDEYDARSGRGVGVVVHGPMQAVLDLVEIEHLATLGIEPWADAVPRPRWVRIRPTRLEGWAFSGPPRLTGPG